MTGSISYGERRLGGAALAGTHLGQPVGLKQRSMAGKFSQSIHPENRRLQAKNELQLQQELRQLNLPLFGVQGNKQGMLNRLKEWHRWSSSTEREMQLELERVRPPVVRGTREGVEQEKRESLMETLLLYSQCLPMAGGLPIGRIGDVEQALQVIHQCDAYAASTLAEAQKSYKGLGFPAGNRIARNVLVDRLQHVVTFNAFPLDELKRECQDLRLVDRESAEFGRDELLQTLYCHLCPEMRVPIDRFDSLEDAAGVGRRLEELEGLDLDEIRARCEEVGLVMADDQSRDECLEKLRPVVVWAGLPEKQLEKECLDMEVDCTRIKDLGKNCRRDRLLDVLLCLANGVPVDRIGFLEAAYRIVVNVLTHQKLSAKDLRDVCLEWNVPVPSTAQKDELIDRLRCVAIYTELPLQELEFECKEWNFSPDDLQVRTHDRREHILELLLCGLNGVPVDRFGTADETTSVACQYVALHKMTTKELQQQSKEWQLPIHETVSRDEYIERLQYAIFWWELPLKELERDCNDWGVKVEDLVKKDSEEETRCQMYDHLSFHLCWETFQAMGIWVMQLTCCSAAWELQDRFAPLETMNPTELRNACSAAGVSAQGLARDGILERLRHLYVWQLMPMRELLEECRLSSFNPGTPPFQQDHVASMLFQHRFGEKLPTRPYGSGYGPPHLRRGGASWPRGPLGFGPPGAPAFPPWQPRQPGQGGNGFPSRPTSFPGGKGFPGRPSHSGAPPANHRMPRRPGFATAAPKAEPNPRAGPGQRPTASKPVPKNLEAHFSALGLKTSATAEEARQAYKRLALHYHPDKNIGDSQTESAKEFIKVQHAYSSLRDVFERRSSPPAST